MGAAGKIIGGVALIGGGLYLYNLTRTAITAGKTEIKFAGINDVKISGGKLKGNIIINAQNPTNFSLNINRILLDVSFNDGPHIASIDINTPVTIPRQSRKAISIPIETDSLLWTGVNIVADFLSSLISKQQFSMPDKAHIKGTITGNGIASPYDEIVPIYESTDSTKK